MIIIFYDIGEHPHGLAGYHLERSSSKKNANLKAYFPLDKYTEEEARVLAHKTLDEWKREASSAAKKEKHASIGTSVNPIKPFSITSHLSVEGVKLAIDTLVVDGKRQLSAAFRIKYESPAIPSATVRIKKDGYRSAYMRAIRMYCESRGLPPYKCDELFDLMPCKEEQARMFMYKLNHQGYKVDLADVLRIIG